MTLTDLQSRNGTYVDSERITRLYAIPGRRIRFGGIIFLLTATLSQPNALDSQDETDDCEADKVYRLDRAELSAAQRPVLELLLQGAGEKQIAVELRLSRHTVHNHARAIYRRLNVHSRSELLALLLRKQSPPSQEKEEKHS